MKHMMSKRILAAALAAVMVLGLAPTASAAAEEPAEEQTPVTEVTEPAEETPAEPAAQAGRGSEISTQADDTIKTWQDLQKAFDAGGEIVLTQDIDTNGNSLVANKDVKITLDLNGFTIDRGGSQADEGWVIQVHVYANLTVKDSSNRTGKITGGNSKWGGGVYVKTGGKFTLAGGSITGNTATYGGGVFCESGDSYFTMTGGSITGNTATYGGGGVYVNYRNEQLYGRFTMTGGSITDNTATYGGGGVYANGPGVTLGGGAVIKYNTTTDGATNNVRIANGFYLNLGTMLDGASIGITTAVTPDANGVLVATGSDGKAADYAKKIFFSDDSQYSVKTKSGNSNNIYLLPKLSSTVKLTRGAHMTSSGSLNQTVDVGKSMDTVTFTAADNYYFPDDYAGFVTTARASTNSGLTVTRVDNKHITVTGSPTTDVELTLADAEHDPWTVTLTPGQHMTPTGDQTQSVRVINSMAAVTFTAETGYYFPSDYTVANVPTGITVTRNSDTKITVSGTPTADVELTLPDAEQDPWTVKLTPGKNMSPDTAQTQSVRVGRDMTEVVFTAADKYWFPTNYTVANVPTGLTVKRSDDGSKITVTGKPTANVDLTLPDAVQRPWTVKLTPGKNMSPTAAQTQEVEVGKAMNQVEFTAGKGYYFPSDYTVAKLPTGLTVTPSKDGTKITVTGTPTADVDLTLPDAEQNPWTVTLTPGAHMTPTGDQTQSVRVGQAMQKVTFTAENGYYFHSDYPGFKKITRALESSGLTVTRSTDGRSVTVTGTPTENVNLTLTDAEHNPWTVKLTPGKNMSSTDSLTQSVRVGSDMTEVVFTAADKYWFPEDYEMKDLPEGLSYQRLNDRQIKITGTPKDDVDFTLPDAEQDPWTVTLTPGQHMSPATAQTQTVRVNKAMVGVKFTADEGYWFPSDYTAQVKDLPEGLKVERSDDGTTVTVSGNPKGNVDFTLPDAEQRPWNVTLTPGDHMSSTDKQIQSVRIGQDLAAVTFTAEQGYYFPDDYAGFVTTNDIAGVNGLTIERSEDGRTVTVKGKPTGDVNLTLTDAEHNPWTVQLTAGDHMSSTDDLEQTVRVINSMAEITFTADEDYYFPDDYAGFVTTNDIDGVNGLTIERSDDGKTVTVSGKPTGDVNLTLTDAEHNPWTVKLTPGDHMSSTGDLEQSVRVINSMTEITFTADEGYYFPEDYEVADVPEGITVKRSDDGKTVTVSGKPTGDVDFTLTDAEHNPWKVKLTPGDHMSSTGDLEQSVRVIDSMTEVIFTADEGYYFPEDYEVADVPEGITVKRSDDGKTVTVSGKPTGDVNLTLTDAPKKPVFIDDGKVVDDPGSYKKGETTNAGGGTFDGWFDENGNELTDVTKAKAGVTYTARWKAPDKAAATVKTGDEGVMLYIGLASAALLAGGAAVLFANRKRREE